MALLLLAFLAQHDLVGVLHALALVGLGRTVAADLRRHLTDLLDVGAADRDRGRLVALDGDAFRNRIGDVVAEAELQVQRLALHRGTVARSEEHTSELQSLMRISYAVFCLKTQTIMYESKQNTN